MNTTLLVLIYATLPILAFWRPRLALPFVVALCAYGAAIAFSGGAIIASAMMLLYAAVFAWVEVACRRGLVTESGRAP